MHNTRKIPWLRAALLLFAAASLAFAASCGINESDGGQAADVKLTALENLEVAESAATSASPDAKLLLVQAPSVGTTGAYPLWVYTFGSPSDNQLYKVNVLNGEITDSSPRGDSPLEDDEWASVPDTAPWEIDSDEAYEAALAVADLEGDATQYSMLLETYVPRSATDSKVTAFVWYVFFNPGDDGEPEAIVAVDARTGEATRVEE